MSGDLTYFKKNAVNYYGVFYDKFDKFNPYNDILTDVRKKYYESDLHMQKAKYSRRVDGIVYRYDFNLNEDTVLKWRVFNDTQIVEKVISASDEKYRVEIRDNTGRILKKCIYFGTYHNWIKTKYYTPGNREPDTQLTLYEDKGVSVILKYTSENNGRPEVLYPCSVVSDEKLLAKITEKLGTPSVSSLCSKGLVYFAEQNVAKLWNMFAANPSLMDERKAADAPDPTASKSVREESVPTESPRPRQRIDLTQTQDVIVPNVVVPDSVVIHANKSFPVTPSTVDKAPDDENSRHEESTVLPSRTYGMTPDGLTLDLSGSSADTKTGDLTAAKNRSDSLFDILDDEPYNQGGTGDVDVFEYLSEDNSTQSTSTADMSDKGNNMSEEFRPVSSDEFESDVTNLDLEIDLDNSITSEFDSAKIDEDFDTPAHEPSETVPERGYEIKRVRTRKPSIEKGRTENIARRAEEKSLDNVKRAYEKLNGEVKDESNESQSRRMSVPVDKIIRVSDDEVYYYFGDTNSNGRREGHGRTIMQNGFTAYDGEYSNDMRNGFGVYYFRTGKICYVGDWKNNTRNGVGVSFNHNDRSMYVGGWDNNCPIGMGAKFDENGNLTFAGRWENGSREGVGMAYNPNDGGVFVSRWEHDVLSDKGTVFDSMGNLVYNGSWKNGVRSGKGTQYAKNGLVVYSGEWKDGKYNGNGTQYNKEGTLVYSGEWKDGKFNGQGSLHLSNGYKVVGSFAMGKIDGYAVLTTKKGKKLYEGEWKNNKYDGDGKQYILRDGSWFQGRFSNGEPVGIMSGYSKDGALLYRGEYHDGKRDGSGICYDNGEKIYEGELSSGTRNGKGHEFADGMCIYSGNFINDKRNGFGTSYTPEGEIEYSGIWKDGFYDGLGLLYEDGEPRFAGSFVMGVLDGRINEIQNGKVVKECIYSDGRCVYMREYINNGTTLKYDGHVKKGLYEGMGCNFSACGEINFEGIFKKNEPFKNMKIKRKNLEPLPYCDEIDESGYNRYISGPNYVVEQEYNGGTYSGLIVNGKPEGKGTLLYADHGYVGDFSDGIACGNGTIYEWDGSEISGTFVKYAGRDTTEITLSSGITYHIQNA